LVTGARDCWDGFFVGERLRIVVGLAVVGEAAEGFEDGFFVGERLRIVVGLAVVGEAAEGLEDGGLVHVILISTLKWM
jgi:hypothetical protein